MTDYQAMSRKQLMRERARYPLAVRNIAEVDARAAELEGERKLAEEQYQRDVEPLQREIANIEEQSIADIQERRQLDPTREQRRKNLAREIETMGVILANKIQDIDRRVELTKAERAKLMADLPNVSVVDTQLFRSGDEQKQLRHNGLIDAIKLISDTALFGYGRRVDAVRDAMNSAHEKGFKSQADEYRQQLTRMEATLYAASDAVRKLRDEAHQIYRELIEA